MVIFQLLTTLAVCVSRLGTYILPGCISCQMDIHCVIQLLRLYFKVNCRQYKILWENFTMLAFSPEPAVFPDQGMRTVISRLETFNNIRRGIGSDAAFLLDVKSWNGFPPTLPWGVREAETEFLFSPFEKRGWIHHKNWHCKKIK